MSSTVYLDIETERSGEIYLVGLLSRGTGLVQLHGRKISRSRLLRVIPKDATIVTFNGTSFDLPRIARHLDLYLTDYYAHLDLRWRCSDHGLDGGQKAIEEELEFPRHGEVLNCWQQWSLRRRWTDYKCQASRQRLLAYNEYDLRGMRFIRNRLRG